MCDFVSFYFFQVDVVLPFGLSWNYYNGNLLYLFVTVTHVKIRGPSY